MNNKIRFGRYILEEESMSPIIAYLYLYRLFSNDIKEDKKSRDIQIRVELSVEENIELENFFDRIFEKAINEIKGRLVK